MEARCYICHRSAAEVKEALLSSIDAQLDILRSVVDSKQNKIDADYQEEWERWRNLIDSLETIPENQRQLKWSAVNSNRDYFRNEYPILSILLDQYPVPATTKKSYASSSYMYSVTAVPDSTTVNEMIDRLKKKEPIKPTPKSHATSDIVKEEENRAILETLPVDSFLLQRAPLIKRGTKNKNRQPVGQGKGSESITDLRVLIHVCVPCDTLHGEAIEDIWRRV